MKTEKIIIEIPSGYALEEVQDVLRRMLRDIGRDPLEKRTMRARQALKNSVWPENFEELVGKQTFIG